MAKEFLGRGWKFPVAVDPVTGKIATSEYEEDIKEAIKIILMTSKGERVMRNDFGCSISDYVYETMDATNLGLVESSIREALMNWEPRIKDVVVTTAPDGETPGRLLVSIEYVVRATNNLFNMVYPFFLKEGTK